MSFGTPEIRYNQTLNKICLELDVRVHTNQPNVYFDGGQIRVQYDTSVFNPNIANSGFFNASLCPDFQSDSYDFYGSYNPTANILNLTAGLSYGYALNRVLLDTVPKPFLHLAFAVNSDSASHGIAFQTITDSLGNPTYATSSNAPFNQYYNFDNIIHLPSDTFTFPNSQNPIIIVMDSTPKIAGIGDSLTIRGFNFGNTRGEVFFKAADDGGQSYLLGLDDQYHIGWSDTLIKATVPSIVYKGYENITGRHYSGGAGSGNIKIQTANSDTTIIDNTNFLKINYSVINTRGSDNIIRRVFLARQHCDYDFQFTLHRNFENDSIKISVMDTALRLWSKLTGLTLRLERDSYGNLVFVDTTNVTGKNIIFFAPNTDHGMMTTNGRYLRLQAEGNIYYGTIGANIQIVPNPAPFIWNYSLSGNVVGQLSFYQAFLHEIGHVLLLGHVNQIDDLMYYANGYLNYIVIPDTSSWAVKGVLANIEASRNINWPANSGLYPIGVRKPTITIAGNKPPYICNGSALTLQANPPGEQFSWSTGATTPTITVNNAGMYSVSLTDGGCTLSDSISIGTSTLQATLTATNVHCPNDASGSITAQVSGNHPPFSFYWYGNGIMPEYTPQINNLLPGNYYLTLSDSVGCDKNYSEEISSQISELTVCLPSFNPNECEGPIDSSLFVVPNCKHPLIVCAYGGAPPYQYSWFYDSAGNPSPGTDFKPLSSTYYICKFSLPVNKSLYVIVQDSCGQSAFREITFDMLYGGNKSVFSSVNAELFPNPATKYLNIHFNQSNYIINKIEIYDIYGKLLYSMEVNDDSANINVSHLAAGIYVAHIFTDKGVTNKKFVKR